MSAVSIRSVKELRELRSRIASLPVVRSRVAARVAEEFSSLAKADFDAKKSPDGEPWKLGADGKTPSLHKSGALESAATTYTAVGHRVRASALSIPYAKYQLRRSFIPRRLPDAWTKRLQEISTEEISRHLSGSR